jgi:hypothetical protein
MSHPPRRYSAALVMATSSTHGSPLILAPRLILSSAAAESHVRSRQLVDAESIGTSLRDATMVELLARIRSSTNPAAAAAAPAARNFRERVRIGGPLRYGNAQEKRRVAGVRPTALAPSGPRDEARKWLEGGTAPDKKINRMLVSKCFQAACLLGLDALKNIQLRRTPVCCFSISGTPRCQLRMNACECKPHTFCTTEHSL